MSAINYRLCDDKRSITLLTTFMVKMPINMDQNAKGYNARLALRMN